MTDLREIPQSRHAEAALLGSMMLDEQIVDDVADIVKSDDFYNNVNRLLFDAILSARRKPSGHVNGQIVRQILEDDGQLEVIGGLEYLSRVIETVPGPSAWRSYAATVREKSAKRQIIVRAGNLLDLAYGAGTVEEIADKASEALSGICGLQRESDEPATMADALNMAYDRIEREKHYTMTAGPVLSEILPGFLGGQMVVVAGRPAQGKTSLALHLCLEGLRHVDVRRALFVSYEMTVDEMAARTLSYESGVAYARMDKRFITQTECGKIVEAVSYVGSTYDIRFATGDGNPYRLMAQARKIHRKEPLACVVVDYVQRMYFPGKFGNRNEELSKISNNLKNLALELQVPVIVLSQLNRSVESREDKHPHMSDLRESGTLEQDADIIITCMRPKKYDTQITDDTMDIDVVKHRNGKEGRATAQFNGPCMRVEAISHFQVEVEQ